MLITLYFSFTNENKEEFAFKLPRGRGFCWLNKLFNCSHTIKYRGNKRGMAKGEFACGLQTVGSFFKTLPLVVFREMVSMVTNLSNAPLVSVRDSPSLLVCTLLFIFILYPFENVQMIQLERLNRTSLILMYIFCLLF